MILANANDLAMIVNYDRNHGFIVLATVITIVNYDCKAFIVQATALSFSCSGFSPSTLVPTEQKDTFICL
jgi:hypothetical protein